MTITEKDQKVINKYVVTQHNNLVEANYSNNLTARALKVARLLISTLNPNNAELGSIDIDITTLKRFLGYKEGVTWGRFHTDLKDIAKRLNKEPIEIGISKGETFVAFFIASYTISLPKGKISFDISPKLKPYLLELKAGYTSYLLANIPKLKSGYSIRLYELLHQYRKIGKRYFEITALQKKVGSSYKLYGDFKRKVILQAQKDLKKHTDLAFVFDERKEGRKVIAIEFIIFGNKPEKEESSQLSFLEDAIEIEKDQDKPALSETIIKAMNELGISEQNIAKYLAMGFDIIDSKKANRVEVQERCKTLENYYLEKLELTKHSAKTDKAAGYFISALKEDWTNSKTLKKSKQEKAAKEIREARKKFEATQRRINQLSQLREDKKAPIIEKLIEEEGVLQTAYDATLAKMGSFMKKHIANVLHLPIKEQYEKAVSITNGINIYLMENYSNRFEEVINITTKIEQAQQEIKVLKQKHPSIS